MSQQDPDANDHGEPYQFGLTSILVLTAVSAAIFAAMRHFRFSGAGGWVVGGYLVLMAAYLILRLPFLMRQLFGRSGRWRTVGRRRNDLAEWVRKRAEQADEDNEDGHRDRPEDP